MLEQMRVPRATAATCLCGFLAPALFTCFSETAMASRISAVKTYGCFETAGVDITVDQMDFDETATVEYRKTGETTFRRGHDFVRYDGNHMATSLFGLSLNTSYDIRVKLADPDGVTGTNPAAATARTRAEYTLPTPKRIVNVANQSQLNTAIAAAKAGDEIRLASGTYAGGIRLIGKSGTAESPIVFTSSSATRPVIKGVNDGAIVIERAAYLVFNNLEVHNENGDGITLRGSHDTAIRKCYVHDSRPGDGTANIMIQHSDEASPAYSGNHLIIDNVISDEVHDPVEENQGPGEPMMNVPGQSYYGILAAYQPGPFITIRRNRIYGVVDGIHPTGDEGFAPVIGPDDDNVLATWRDQNLGIYDNVIYDCKDDGIECDGHMVNGRIFRNRIGKCENALSAAPLYAGPLFVLRNYMHGFHQGVLKQNTGVSGISRRVLFYHNTVMEKPRSNPAHCDSEYTLYRGEPAEQQDFVYLNNIFSARGRVYNGDNYSPGTYHRNDRLDYNLMYSTRQSDKDTAFKWVADYDDPLNNTRYPDLASFRDAVSQEPNGTWGNPRLSAKPLAGYPKSSKLLDLRITAGSPAIDKGTPIPGINDNYKGAGPDIGAYEVGAGREHASVRRAPGARSREP